MEFDLLTHLKRQRDFSIRTFGPGTKTEGVVRHIEKECAEIRDKPDDLSEWIDVIILACDGALRRGFTPDQIVEELERKQGENETRQWPDWRTVPEHEPIEHIRGE